MRDPEKTRRRILDAGFGVIYRQGFRASSVNEIVSKAGVTQGAFFHYFPAKNDLGYALADEILKDMMVDRWTKPLAAYRNPIQGVISHYRKLMEELTDEEVSLGCPLNNLTQEMSAVDPVFRDKLREVLVRWIGETERYLRKAQEDGYLKSNVDPRSAAEFLVMMEEGSGGLMKVLRDRRIYRSLYEGYKQYVESISSKPREGTA